MAKLNYRIVGELKEIGIVPDYLERYGPSLLVGVVFGRKTLKEYTKGILRVIETLDGKIEPITIVIGYSMGGLIARAITPKLNHVKKLILIGTPNQGIDERYLKPWTKMFLWRIKCVKDAFPNSDFLKRINSDPPLKCEVFLIAGKKDRFVPLKSALGIPYVPKCHRFVFPLGHSELIPQQGSSEEGAIELIVQLSKNP